MSTLILLIASVGLTLAQRLSAVEPSAIQVETAMQEPGAMAVLAATPTTETEPATHTPPPSPAPATPAQVPTTTPWPAAAPTSTPQPARVTLTGLRHFWQTWNNCGPATLAMNLSFFGSDIDQAEAGSALRLNPDDKNVNPHELAAYARRQGFAAKVVVNGDAATLRLLLDHGLPVLIETWLEPEPDDGMGHYRLLTGYDDADAHWIAYDSYVGVNLVNPDGAYRGIRLLYGVTDALWKVFNRTFLLVYPPDLEAKVASLLGEAADPATMWQRSMQTAQQEIAVDPNNAFAHFNLGSSLAALGDHTSAAASFDTARVLGLPWRMLWYQFGPFESYTEVGRFQDVIELTDATLSPEVQLEELFFWRSRAFEGLGDEDAARTAFAQAERLNTRYAAGVTTMPAGVTMGKWE